MPCKVPRERRTLGDFGLVDFGGGCRTYSATITDSDILGLGVCWLDFHLATNLLCGLGHRAWLLRKSAHSVEVIVNLFLPQVSSQKCISEAMRTVTSLLQITNGIIVLTSALSVYITYRTLSSLSHTWLGMGRCRRLCQFHLYTMNVSSLPYQDRWLQSLLHSVDW